MSRSAAFGGMLTSLGVWWPEGNAETMREAAKSWAGMAEGLEDVEDVLAQAARMVFTDYSGEAAEHFRTQWQLWTDADGQGGTAYLPETASDCRKLARSLRDFAGDMDRADATIAQLVEQALAGMTFANQQEYEQWLRESAGIVGDDLAGKAAQHGAALQSIRRLPGAGTPTDLQAVDAAAIGWVDPGDPRDLSHVADSPVDFGAGEGDLSELEEMITSAAEEQQEGRSFGSSSLTESEQSGDGSGSEAAAAFGGGGGGGFGGGGGGGGGYSPSGSAVSIPVPREALIAGGAAAAGAAAAAAGSGRMPFFPMMPMGGGAGDDGEEPRRRKVRR